MNSFLSLFSNSSPPAASRTSDEILTAFIGYLMLAGAKRTCALIGYSSGFQVWEVSGDPVEILSKRTIPISQIHAWNELVALVTPGDVMEFNSRTIRLYSPESDCYVHLIKAFGVVARIAGNRSVLCALLEAGSINVYSYATYEVLFSLKQDPLPDVTRCFALSFRYIAYTTTEKPSYRQSIRTLTRSSTGPETMGKVIICSINPNEYKLPAIEFQASTTVTHLAISASSHLLLTAENLGREFKVYKINAAALGNTSVLIYQLYRGMTTASISDVVFSADERWVAVSSAKGTTHVYAIDPAAKAVNGQTKAQAVIKRRQGLAEELFPQCVIEVNARQQQNLRCNFEVVPTGELPPTILAITRKGRLYKTNVGDEVSKEDCLRRQAQFEEICQLPEPKPQQDQPVQLVNELEMETHEHQPGWLPFIASPQFEFCETEHAALFQPLQIQEYKRVEARYDNTLTFIYEDSYQEAVKSHFEDIQSENPKINERYIENSLYFESGELTDHIDNTYYD